MKANENKLKQGLLIMISIGLLHLSCEQDVSQNCEGDNAQPIETFYEADFEEVNCHLQNIESKGKETHLIVKNQEEYETYFSCIEELPAIDFDEYFILAGVYSHHQCAIFYRQSVVICGNRLNYRVRLREQDCMAAIGVQYFTFISKEYENMKIEFDVVTF